MCRTLPVVPAKIAHSCLLSVPFGQQAALDYLDSIIPYLDWQTDPTYKANPPPDYFFPPHDYYAAMEKVRQKVAAGQYASEYAFQDDFYKSVFGPAHDSHMVVYPDALSRAFQWQRQRSLVSISEDGMSLPVIKVYAGLSLGYFAGGGRLRYVYQGPQTSLTFDNGTKVTFENQALVKGNMTGVVDGPSFYEKFCTPRATDDSSAETQLVSDDSQAPSADQPVSSDYPKPVRASADGVISGYYLEGKGLEDVAVLSVLNFDPAKSTEFQSVMDDFFKSAKAAGKTKLIIDLQANAGGFAILGYEVFGQLFPQQKPQDNGRWRKNPGFDAIARSYSEAVAGVDLATTPSDDIVVAAETWFNWRHDLNTSNLNFQSFEDKFAPQIFAETPYTALMRWNLSDPLEASNATFGLGIEFSGYGAGLIVEDGQVFADLSGNDESKLVAKN
ncbi:Peptidase S41 family protein ustP like [Verticillium longisporum]|nr:Peptidase S41 family protein ustP like [Verticillium longisporum]